MMGIVLLVALGLGVLSTSDERALRIADEMMEALGGEDNWEQARFIRFTFVRGDRKPTFTWDKWDGRLRLESRNDAAIPYVVLMNVKTRQGRAWVEGRELRGSELSEYLNRAYAMWAGEIYWFLMPFKWKDPGVILTHEGEETLDGTVYDVVHLAFDNVGRTPGDEFWAYVNRETHLMDRWRFKLESGFEGDYRWSRWHRYGGIRVATERTGIGNDDVIRFEEIYIGQSMPDEIFTSPEPVTFP